MSHVVVKPFKTVNRKFKPGDAVTAADFDVESVVTFDGLITGGFVRAEGPAASAPAKSSAAASPTGTE